MKVILENGKYANVAPNSNNSQTASSIERNDEAIVENKPTSSKKNSSVSNNAKNKLMLVMQDYKDGQITRKREYYSEGKSNESIIILNKVGNDKYIKDSENISAIKSARVTSSEVSKRTTLKHNSRKLVFKSFLYPNVKPANIQSRNTYMKGLDGRGGSNKKSKIFKPLKYVDRSLLVNDQSNVKPTFKITRPPILEQKRPDQASLMGLFPSKLNK
ncbi:hypothetical protein C6P41_001039 [Kluyveromyces marxianus]|nr:hypothetical protein C6P43_001420 [Kluyveromyces marxianus]KAG0678515.1 hypothetical protein C6P41_001039 [Kluyveromyces marxianus]